MKVYYNKNLPLKNAEEYNRDASHINKKGEAVNKWDNNAQFPDCKEIHSAEDFEEIKMFPIVATEFKDGWRSNENFIEATFLKADFDNGTPTWDEFIKENKYECLIYGSKNDQQVKEYWKNGIKIKDDTISACDRFHVLFFLTRAIKSKEEYTKLEKKMQLIYATMDPSCKDSSRQFYGTSESRVAYLKGKCILEDLDLIKDEERKTNQTSLNNNSDKDYLNPSCYTSPGRHEKFTQLMGHWFHKVSHDEEGKQLLKTLLTDFNNKTAEPLSEDEFKDVIRSVDDYWTKNNKNNFIIINDKKQLIEQSKIDSLYTIVDSSFIDELNENYLITLQNNRVEIYNKINKKSLSEKTFKFKYSKHLCFISDKVYQPAVDYWIERAEKYDQISFSAFKEESVEKEGQKIYYILDKEAFEHTADLSKKETLIKYVKLIDEANKNLVPSKYKTLNLQMRGGFRRGWMYGFHTFTGGGKSIEAFNEACWLSLQGFNVFYFDSENGITYSIQMMTQILNNSSWDNVKGSLASNNFKLPQNLLFHEYQSKLVDINYFENFLENSSVKPDIIFFDLLDDVAAQQKTEQEWLRLQFVSEDLARLALKYNIVVIVTTQSNREDSKSDGTISKNKGGQNSGGGVGKMKKLAGLWHMSNDFPEQLPEYSINHRRLTNAGKRRGFDPTYFNTDVVLEYYPETQRLEEIPMPAPDPAALSSSDDRHPIKKYENNNKKKHYV